MSLRLFCVFNEFAKTLDDDYLLSSLLVATEELRQKLCRTTLAAVEKLSTSHLLYCDTTKGGGKLERAGKGLAPFTG